MKKDNRKFIPIPKDEYFKKITKYQYQCPFDQTLSCQSVIRKNQDGESYFIASIKISCSLSCKIYLSEKIVFLAT